ncbi:Uncharacterized protein BP5553_03477 [Venustampulla echinocandica]|uniref:Nucleic acid-binding protein n=1 Tax=Venustampulla echinocandica TaxID=2656787 RepID=A0A370TUD2_9HELO|nr:Uncharacterized protein BP5553_03477 [Venustampulla echinocandica]RDL39137.1 Uncharacterized protein BP5553_03477 [Venustampulla echinocandica]
MTQSYPSVQSFYMRETPTEGNASANPSPSSRADGFTEEELADAFDPLNRKWNPEREYEETTIDNLIPGPRAVTFVGRVVNFSTILGNSQKQPQATGWHYLVIKDDTAAISIKLYFARQQYPLKLGQLLSIWTCFISDISKAEGSAIIGVRVYANLFPGRVNSDHVMIPTSSNTDGICHVPPECRKAQPLPGLMTLASYLGGGYDGVDGAKILVCVKSIGGRRKITKKKGGESELTDIQLFDHTGEVRLTVWNEMIDSARDWQPGKTILMISNPGYKVGYSKGSVGITWGTMIDVGPEFSDAEWLRKYAVGLTKKESLCMEFPEDLWDVEATEYGVNRMFFTLAELDRWVRSDGHHVFTGFINVTVIEMSLVSLQCRNMLSCGVPIYANALTTPCRNCSSPLNLRLNPKIIGTLLDETGCIAPGKLLWSDRAWEQLFNRTIKDITEMSSEEARWYEQRIMFMRMHLVVGWAENVGRLAVLGIMM